MTAKNRRALRALDTLIATCKDGENGYRRAAGDLHEHEQLKELFGSYAEQRVRFVSELLAEAHRLDVPEERQGTTLASAHRGWMGLKSVLAGKGSEGAIAACERGERSALKKYQAALKKTLPPETRALLEKQLAALQEAHARVQAMKAVATLNVLIATCRDGAKGYEGAAASVQDAELKELFHSCSQQRAQFAAELEAVVQRLGDTARHDGTFAALLHRGWMKAEAAFARGKVVPILVECERGERMALKHYEAALKHDLPPDLRALVERQLSRIQEARARLHAMKRTRKT